MKTHYVDKYPDISFNLLSLNHLPDGLFYVNSYGTYNKRKSSKRKYWGRSEVVKIEIQAGLPYVLEGSEGHVPISPLLYKIRYGTYILKERSTKNEIEFIVYTGRAVKSGKKIREADSMKYCLTQIEFNNTLKSDLKAKIPYALSTGMKYFRNRFIKLLG